MAGPSTEYLADQIDRLRDQVGATRDDIQAARREALDGSRQVGDIFAAQIQEIRETMVDEMTRIRDEVGAGREALKVDQSRIREDLAALNSKTTSMLDRFDKTQDLLKQLMFWLLSISVTVGGAIIWQAWQAGQVVQKIEEQGRRLEAIEKASEGQSKLRESVDQLRKAIEARATAPASGPTAR